jgi:type I restriction enzyme S subunit
MPVDEDGPFMLTANDVGYGKIFFETARRTSQEAFDKELTDKSRPKRDDLLVTKDGTLGRVSIFNGEASCINQSVALVRLDKEKLLPFFALFCLISPPYQEMMLFDARGTTIKHIYITRLSKMPLAFPEPREQLKVVEHLKDKIHQVSSIEKKTADAIEKLKEYRSALITNAVTGKIDVENEASREQTQ